MRLLALLSQLPDDTNLPRLDVDDLEVLLLVVLHLDELGVIAVRYVHTAS